MHTPPLDAIRSPANVLFVQDSHAHAESDPCSRLQREPTAVMYVTFGDAPDRTYANRSATVGRVSIGNVLGRSGSRADTADSADVVVESVPHPTDLSAIGCAISRLCDRLGGPDERLAVCFDSLDALLAYSPSKRVFRFVHLLTNRLSAAGALAHVHFDVTGYDEPLVSTFERVFDRVVDDRSSRQLREATDEEIARAFAE